MSGNPYHGLLNAVRRGDLDRIKTFVDTFRLSNSLERLKGYNLLREAILTNQTAIAKLLLISGSKVNSKSKKPTHTPLHYAVINNNVELVNMLLDRSANVNAKNPDGKTPLCFAVKNGIAEITRSLLESGANVNAESKFGITPLHLTAELGDVQITALLLNRGACVNFACSLLNHEGYTPLHYASKRGNEELVKLLLDNGADINASTEDESTALHFAAGTNQKKVVKVLFEHGGCDINARNKDGETALHCASAQGHEELVKFLLDNGADINASTLDGSTALHAAAQNGGEKIVKVLLEYGVFDINARNKNGETALHHASARDHVKLVNLLLDNGADINANNEDRSTALHVAAEKDHVKFVKMLLEYGGCDINARDKDGNTALHYASAQDHENTAKVLLEYKGCDINARNKMDETPLHKGYNTWEFKVIPLLFDNGADMYAKATGDMAEEYISSVFTGKLMWRQFKTLKVLLEYGGCDINARSKRGITMLDYFHSKGCEDFINFLRYNGVDIEARSENNYCMVPWFNGKLRKHFIRFAMSESFDAPLMSLYEPMGARNVLKVILKHGGFDVNYPDKNGKTILDIAVESGDSATVKNILRLCPKINIKNNRRCLRDALNGHRCSKKLVKILLKYGFTVYPEDANDCYILHNAIRYGFLKIIEDLLLYGADVNSSQRDDDKGYTLLHTALIHRQIEAAKLLINHGADVNAKAKNGNVPLFYAIEWSDVNMTKLLLASGASMRDRYDLLHTAVKTGTQEIVEIILENLDCDINGRDYFGRTALYFAVDLGNKKIVELLLDKGADTNGVAQDKSTVLHVAAKKRANNLVKVLLKHGGCDVNARNENGKTILEIAVESSDSSTVKDILELCPEINFKNNGSCLRKILCNDIMCREFVEILLQYGFTVHSGDAKNCNLLHSAIERGCLKIINDLLMHDADVNSPQESNGGYTTLHNAADHGQIEAAKLLINYGADVNAKNRIGWFPLSYAVTRTDINMAKLLVSNGASMKDCSHLLRTAVMGKSMEMVEFILGNLDLKINTSDDFGRTALHSAVVLRQPNGRYFCQNEDDPVPGDIRLYMAGVLLSRGADVHAQDKNGLTPLHAAIERQYASGVVEILLKYNANVNCADNHERTPLHYSAKAGNPIVTKMLLNHGANVNAKDENGDTPLYVACECHREEVVATLLEYGAEIDARNNEGLSPLHIAAADGYLEIVKNLLEVSAEIDCRDKRGRTALHMALWYGRIDVIEELLAYGSDIYVTCQKGHTTFDYAKQYIPKSIVVEQPVSLIAEESYGRRLTYVYDDKRNYNGDTPDCDSFRKDIDHDYALNGHNAINSLKQHMLKMNALNSDVAQRDLAPNQTLMFRFNNFSNNDCKREVIRMKNRKFGNTDISFYDLLNKSIKQLAAYARKEVIVKNFESARCIQQFPIYGNMIDRNFKRGKKRNTLLNPSLESLNFLFGFMLPDVVSAELLSYLSNKDLDYLIKATTLIPIVQSKRT